VVDAGELARPGRRWHPFDLRAERVGESEDGPVVDETRPLRRYASR
jgi:hypothetical protein